MTYAHNCVIAHSVKCLASLMSHQINRCNFCRGDLTEIRQRLRDYYEYWLKSNFKNATVEWEHMTRCLIESMNFYPYIYMPYKSMLLIAIDLLDLNMPRLYASLNYPEWIAYKTYK